MKKTKFSLGTLNSELQEQEIQIPDGYEASIKDGKIIFRKSESEDEKIRKILVGFFKGYKEEGTIGAETFNGIPTDNILAWLEKQGNKETLCGKCRKEHPSHSCQDITALGRCVVEHEQKPSDKLKSKFHEGDWIIFNGITLLIEEVVQGYYRTVSMINDIHNSYDWSIDNVARLWTIQDAKDGDVLTCYSNYNDKNSKPFEQAGIFKKYIGKYKGCTNCFLAHIGIDWDGNIETDMYMGSTNIFPATKEQRDYFLAETSKAGFKV
jgi:hypothetical protein